MSNDSTLNQWEQSIVDGSFFSDTTNALQTAQQNGFMVVNADIPDADGFLAVNDEVKLPGYGSNKVIGVRANMGVGDKQDMIAQELARYFVQRRHQPEGTMKLVQMDMLRTKSAGIAACIKAVRDTTDKLQSIPETEEHEKENKDVVAEAVVKTVARCLDVPIPDTKTETVDQEKGYEWGKQKENEDQQATSGKLKKIEDVDYTQIDVQHDIVYTNHDLNTQYMTEQQIKRDIKITDFFGKYLLLFKSREEKKIHYRQCLFYGSGIMTIAIIVTSFILLFMWMPKMMEDRDDKPLQMEITLKAEQENTRDSDAVKIIVIGNDDDEAVINAVAAAISGRTGGETTLVVQPGNAGAGIGADNGNSNGDNNDNSDGDSNDGDGSNSGSSTLTGALQTIVSDNFEDNAFIAAFTALAAEADSGNTGDIVKDIVSLVTICLTILGSILAIIKLFTTYILPLDEEDNMYKLMNTVQENDFEHEMALLLIHNKVSADNLVEYLKTCKETPPPEKPNEESPAPEKPDPNNPDPNKPNPNQPNLKKKLLIKKRKQQSLHGYGSR